MGAEFDLDRIGGARAVRDLVDEVLASGDHACELYRGGAGNRARQKPDQSPVTEADEAVERRIRAFCARRFPGSAFLGEEGGEQAGPGNLRFVVDPIDGTRAFLRGIPTWAVVVGVEFDGEPVIGVVYMPAAGDIFVAARGHGVRINGRPATLSRVNAMEDSVVTHGSLSQFRDAGCLRLLDRLANDTYTQRGFCDFDGYRQLLLGRVDAMVDPGVKAWDICAPAVLVREAGGQVTDFGGRETVHSGSCLASNGALHEAMVGLTRAFA